MLQPTTSLGGRLRRASTGVSVGKHLSRNALPHDNPTCLCGFEIWRASGKQGQKKNSFQLCSMILEMMQ
jgi:hypothetical protein